MTKEEAIADIRDNIKPVVGGISLDMAIKSLEAWEKVREEIKVIRDRECLENDSFDEYSEGRYDVACECLRIIDKHLAEVSE